MNEETVTTTTIEPIGSGARLRQAPSTRFSGSQHVFDLVELSANLLNEDHSGANGHRQMTIFRHDATTMVLFAFEAGGQLTDHKANGLVTIHALDGALTVEAQGVAEWQRHDLRAQQILVLNPGVLHNVTAHEAGRMLLTIQLVKNTPALQR
jgi:quercetin dioxygenase-like cupin family protein